MSNVSFKDLIGKKTLILGDVGVGKTQLTRRLLAEAVEQGHSREITVIEMAPEAMTVKGLTVGGRLLNPKASPVRLLEGRDIKAPRLSARNGREVLELAERNAAETRRLLEEFLREPTRVLFVNDLSIYLHRGDLEYLWRALQRAETVVANAYRGDKLKNDLDTGLSDRERQLVDTLEARMDVVLYL
ncbi:MAG: hypothetical protein QW057_04645 [Candidatus Bathyarchaeia archaeon]